MSGVDWTLRIAQRQGLERLRRRAVGRVSQRAHMVLLAGRGYPVAEIARIFDCGEEVVRQWLHRYRERGEAALEDLPRSGCPPKDRLAAQIVDTQASQPPTCSGHVQTCWTVGLLAAFLAAHFQLALSPSRVRQLLRQMGWTAALRASAARPRLAPATHAPHGQRKDDPATAVKLALIAQALAGTATVLYLDECELQLLPLVRAMWMKGPRVRVPTPGQNTKRAFFGALDARIGALHHAVQPRKLATHFVDFLDRLAVALFAVYAAQRGRAGAPRRLLFDIDATDDLVHSDQEGAARTARETKKASIAVLTSPRQRSARSRCRGYSSRSHRGLRLGCSSANRTLRWSKPR